MQALLALLGRHGPDEEPLGDAVCTVSVDRRRRRSSSGKRGGQDRAPCSPLAVVASGWGWACVAPETRTPRGVGPPSVGLADLCAGPASLIWEALGPEDQRSLRLSDKQLLAVANAAVTRLELTAKHGVQPRDVRALAATFPGLGELRLLLGPEPALPLLCELKAARFAHLHSFHCDARLRDDALLAVGRFLVHTPSLVVLGLPNQRGASAADQRVLCAVLEALPRLAELDLGGAGGSSAANAVSPSALRRIVRLPRLRRLAVNASAVPDEQLAALGQLRGMRALSICAAGDGAGLAAALGCMRRLATLELEHTSLASDALAGALGGLRRLRVLSLGLCPNLSAERIMPELAGLSSVTKLSLPFSLGGAQLRCLSHLPALCELLTFNGLELDVLGPAHEPLAGVTKLVASSISSHGRPLASFFPHVHSVVLKCCGDAEADALRGCAGLAVLHAGECGALSDQGFACLRGLRGLQWLQLDDAAQLSDAAFAAVFSSTMPALQHISIGGASCCSDRALQLLTASCRRLASISISSCRQLSDKTLKRLAHCEHLASVRLAGCPGFTGSGVAALAASPHVRCVSVNGCSGVRRSECAGVRPGVRLRIDDRPL